jgi:hypothetical protein
MIAVIVIFIYVFMVKLFVYNSLMISALFLLFYEVSSQRFTPFLLVYTFAYGINVLSSANLFLYLPSAYTLGYFELLSKKF